MTIAFQTKFKHDFVQKYEFRTKDNVNMLGICKVVCIKLFEISCQLQQTNRQKLKFKGIEGRAISITEYFSLLDCIRQVFDSKRHLHLAVFPMFSIFCNFCCWLPIQIIVAQIFSIIFLFLHLNILKLFLLGYYLVGNLIKCPNQFICHILIVCLHGFTCITSCMFSLLKFWAII